MWSPESLRLFRRADNRKPVMGRVRVSVAALLTCAASLRFAVPAAALLPSWLQHTVAASEMESALFRAMNLPGVSVLFPRPPAESVSELNRLVAAAPSRGELLLLRSRQEESALDLAAAERDLKAYVAMASTDADRKLALADFYHRRLAPAAEFATLLDAGNVTAAAAADLQRPDTQTSWQAFERALRVANNASLPVESFDSLWQHWIGRYPQQPSVYGRAFTWNLNHHRLAQAQAVLDRYQKAFPGDAVFPVKASALLILATGGPDAQARALAHYESAFQPLWPGELVNSYFDLLAATHNTRRFVSENKTRLEKNPEDLNAVARLFLFYRHDGHPETAATLLENFRRSREGRDAAGHGWSPDDLNTLARLCTDAQIYPEAARYDFALYNLPGKLADGRSAQQAGLAGMISILLTAPDQPVALGSSNLSMYRDMGTIDDGPGFWNGILSLWLNSQSIPDSFADEESKAQPYFHRAAAAALLKMLDEQAPSAPERPGLHAQLLGVYAGYGEDSALLSEGEHFLASFPDAPERTTVALLMADAHARAKDSAAEFDIYDRLLRELGREANNMPLSAAAVAASPAPSSEVVTPDASLASDETAASESENSTSTPSASRAFDLDTGNPVLPANPAAAAYVSVLDRYLGRLTATHQLPQALAVLRKELDRNPNDPRLYERLADFLSQNNLSSQEEELYRAAIAKFGGTSWQDKLARFYLREKRRDAFAALTKEVTGIFSGTDLDAYFTRVNEGGPQLFLELNLYAHKRFPHDLIFTNNLLAAYTAKPTADRSAWEHLLRESWWQSPELTSRFFEWLSQTGKLSSEIAGLEATVPAEEAASPQDTAEPNAAALTELAEANLWLSRFEQSRPLFDRLADLYPTDTTLGTADADLNRSLAWLDASGPAARITRAVAVEQRLLLADSADQARRIRIGDFLADHADGTSASYAPAAALWRAVPAAAPGVPGSYLDAATVFWDYFQFDDALHQIDLARTHFARPALFGYEAGAILEGKRDFPAAVREYVRAALAGSGAGEAETNVDDRQIALDLGSKADLSADIATDPSTERLLQLARRPSTAGLVDKATEAAVDTSPALPALRLRLAVLDAQHRTAEKAPLLLGAIRRAATADGAADLASFAQKGGDTAAYEAALRRETELTPDPVEKLELTYQLVDAFIARNDLADATQLVDKTYNANPRLLGVVRFTVDFNWSHGRQGKAVAVLIEASHAAQPLLARRFTAEAASDASESGDTSLGRSLAASLLASDPYNAQFLGLAAESYTKAGDTAGLQRFYRERLDAIRTAPMSVDERKTRTALLRRGLLPSLITDKQYAAATDEYIALISAYPEDSSLIREAALFALRYSQESKLRGFYAATVGSSPRDARFFIALAQTEDIFGDPSAALNAYARAVALRPERTDLYIAKAALEERLQRFDAAAADYARLFQLSYKDPQWMVAAAQAQARQGHPAEAVKALEAAFLHGAQTSPHDLFTVASQLEGWNMLPEAVGFAERGAAMAGPDLLAGQPPAIAPEDAAVYARVLTRARRTSDVLGTLRLALAGLSESPSSPTAVAAQVRSAGLASVTDAEWRRQFVAARRQRAQAQFTAAVLSISRTIAAYGTPEDRAAYVSLISQTKAAAPAGDVSGRWIPAAHEAGLANLEASWRSELLNDHSREAAAQITPFIALEQTRLSFAELAGTLERFAIIHPKSSRHAEALQVAVNAYRAEGNFAAALHLLRTQRFRGSDNTTLRDTYLDLLVHHDTSVLIALGGAHDDSLADATVATALAGGSPSVALSAVHARSVAQPPVWSAFYTGLTGLYFGDRDAVIDTSFRQALLPDATVGERLSSHPDTAHQLAGDLWFYDAARYGQWRLLSPATSADADDVLAADLERSPDVPNYLALAQTEAEAGLPHRALLETAHALELSPGSTDVLDARAVLLWGADRKAEATASWRTALVSLRSDEDAGPAPESFWSGFSQIALRVRQHGLFAELRPAMDELLRSYLARNGTYRSNELLQAAFLSAPDEATGLSLILNLSAAAADPAQVLQDLGGAAWLSPTARQQVFARAFELLRAKASPGDSASEGALQAAQARAKLLQLLVENHEDAEALALVQAAPENDRSSPQFATAELVAAARSGHLAPLLTTFDVQTALAPSADTVRSAAASLAADNHWDAARSLLEWSFARANASHNATASDYLPLAEARIQTHDTTGAVDLLHSFVADSATRYADEDSAAALLEESHLSTEAMPFLKELAVAVPWDLSYRVRLAEAQRSAGVDLGSAAQGLLLVARNNLAPYELRTRAARDLASSHPSAESLGSAELNLLASGSVSPSAASQPLFVAARVAAAAQSTELKTKLRLLREALAMAPQSADAGKLRLEVFNLSAQAGETTLARAVLDQTLAEQNAPNGTSQTSARTGLLQYLDPAASSGADDLANSGPALPVYAASFSGTEKATLAERIAHVYTGTNDLASASRYLGLAEQLSLVGDKHAPGKDRIRAEMTGLDEKMRLAAENASRQPTVHKALDQASVVRVRLGAISPDLLLLDPAKEP